jgi:hypothetical protein
VVYIPADGVSDYKNDQIKINKKGLEFKQALFGI